MLCETDDGVALGLKQFNASVNRIGGTKLSRICTNHIGGVYSKKFCSRYADVAEWQTR